jgi:hypothetical protein
MSHNCTRKQLQLQLFFFLPNPAEDRTAQKLSFICTSNGFAKHRAIIAVDKRLRFDSNSAW